MDKDLLKEIKSGNQEALATALQEQYSFIYKYVQKLTGDHEMSMDLTQDTMIKAIQSIHSYKPRAKFSTWLIRIATNIYYDQKRKEKRSYNYINHQIQEYRSETREEDWFETSQALLDLEDQYKVPILLKHYYGYEYKEISSMLRIRTGTVKSRVHYGLEILRKELQDERL